MKRISAGSLFFSAILFVLILTGCVHHGTPDRIRPSAVPEKRLTKTAIAPESDLSANSSDITDIWEECSLLPESDPTLWKVSELPSDEFRRRVQITFMIPNEDADSAFIATRCMNGKVYACFLNTDTNCLERLDLSMEADEVMNETCADPSMQGNILPARLSTRKSAFEWACLDGKAVAIGIRSEVDAAGYEKALWPEIPAPGE